MEKMNGRALKHNAGLYVLFAAMFMAMVGFGIIMPVLPTYAKELNASGFEMGLFMSLFALFQFVFSPVWGRLSDKVGRKRVLLLGLTTYGLSFFAMGMARSFWILLIARSIAGVFSGATYPTGQAYVADATTGAERGPVMGQMGAANNLGFILGPVIGGILHPLGIRAVFFIAGSCVLTTVLALAVFLPDVKASNTASSGKRLNMKLVSDALREPYAVFFVLTIAVAFANSTNFSMMGYYVVDKLHTDELGTSVVYTVMGATSAICQAFLIRYVIRVWGERGTIIRGLFITTAGYLLFTTAPSISILLCGIVISSIGNALLWPTMTAAISTRTTMGQGLTMGIQNSFSAAARTLGPLWGGFIYDSAIYGPCLTATVISFGTAVIFPSVLKNTTASA